MSYKYYLYGLNVESEIEMDEVYLKDFSCDPDVRIVIGKMPEDVKKMYADKTHDDNFCAVSQNALAFQIANVADYYVTKDTITVEAFENTELYDIKAFILGSCFGFCMILRKKLVIHGGGISKYDKGVIITGESGAGKSTVTDRLLDKEFVFIADDVCALSDVGKKSHIELAYPQQKLCRDAALKKGYNLSELIYIDDDRDKYAIRLKDNFLPQGKDLDFLFELVISDDNKLSFRKVTGQEKLMMLLRNVYRGEGGFKYWGIPPEYMKMCLKTASSIEIYQIARPKNEDTLNEIVEFIDKTVKGV